VTASRSGLEGFRALCEELQAAGHDPRHLCADVDPTPGGVDANAIFAHDVHSLARLLLRAEIVSGDPLLGLHLAARASGRGILWSALRAQRSVGDALRMLVQLASVVWGPYGKASLHSVGASTVLRYELPDVVPRHAIEYLVARTVIGLRIAGVTNLDVWFGHPPACGLDAYREILRCTPRFRQPETRVGLPTAELDRSIPTGNPLLAAAIASAIEALQSQAPATVAAAVADRVRAALQEGRGWSREALARGLGMSGKTLARRLEAERRSFRDVVADVSRALAQQLVEDVRVDLTKAAEGAGFSDLAAFGKAFRRWFGTSPSAYRAGLESRIARRRSRPGGGPRRRMSSLNERPSAADERRGAHPG
jgi:AraC-like DNA-binding protein